MSESSSSINPQPSCDPSPRSSALHRELNFDTARSSTALQVLKLFFSFPTMLAGMLVAIVFVRGRMFIVDPDLWWHVKVGNVLLATHRWPTIDTYSFTVAGQPWLAYEWLGDVLLAGIYRLSGLAGLLGLLICLGSSVVIALYGFATTCSKNSKAGFLTAALLSVLATMSFSLRPQMLGYLFLILTLLALERFREGKRSALWLLPALMLVWVNTHGSWIIGLGTILVYWMSGLAEFRAGNLKATRWSESQRVQIACVFLLSLITLPITPYGTRIAASPFEFAFALPLNVANIDEWQSMPFNTLIGKIFLALVLGIIIAAVTLHLSWPLEGLVLFIFGTALACLHVRFLLVFVPFATPVVARIVSLRMPKYEIAKDKFAINAALMCLVVIGMIRYFPSGADLQRRVAKTFPVKAVSYLQSHPMPEPMYNNYGYGGYLVLLRGPEHKVFIDGRGDVYERGGVLADYLHISRLKPGALAVLRGYRIQSCLIEKDEPLSTLLSASSEWRRAYMDDSSSIFVRTEPWK